MNNKQKYIGNTLYKQIYIEMQDGTSSQKAANMEKYNEVEINLTISSPISGVMLMLLLLILRASDGGAPSDL